MRGAVLEPDPVLTLTLVNSFSGESPRTLDICFLFLTAPLQAIADVHGAVLEPDPALTLTRVNSFSGESPRTLAWPPHSEEVVFAAGSTVVAMQVDRQLAAVGRRIGGSWRAIGLQLTASALRF